MKIVVKVGTQAILSEDCRPIEKNIFNLVDQISQLRLKGHEIVLVSSGAVGLGRNIMSEVLHDKCDKHLKEKRVLASLGQHKLISIYANAFSKYNMLISQFLLTKHDFQTREHYLNIAKLLRATLKHRNIVPVINENDSVVIESMMFTDNDELASLIAAQMDADKLIILSNIDGVYDSNPKKYADAKLINIIDPDEHNLPAISCDKSMHGRGGMKSKLCVAQKMSQLGIVTHIANINHDNVLNLIVADQHIGTTIISSRKSSNIKRWIAFNSDKYKGAILVNVKLFNILKEEKKIISILPVGIEGYIGNFKERDLVEILGPQGEKIGIGIARYESEKLNEFLGFKSKPVFIHYDQLHIF